MRYIGIHDYGTEDGSIYANYILEDDDPQRPHITLMYDQRIGWRSIRWDWTADEIDASIRELSDQETQALLLMLPVADLPAAIIDTDRVCVAA